MEIYRIHRIDEQGLTGKASQVMQKLIKTCSGWQRIEVERGAIVWPPLDMDATIPVENDAKAENLRFRLSERAERDKSSNNSRLQPKDSVFAGTTPVEAR